jgi:hypothetical protein
VAVSSGGGLRGERVLPLVLVFAGRKLLSPFLLQLLLLRPLPIEEWDHDRHEGPDQGHQARDLFAVQDQETAQGDRAGRQKKTENRSAILAPAVGKDDELLEFLAVLALRLRHRQDTAGRSRTDPVVLREYPGVGERTLEEFRFETSDGGGSDFRCRRPLPDCYLIRRKLLRRSRPLLARHLPQLAGVATSCLVDVIADGAPIRGEGLRVRDLAGCLGREQAPEIEKASYSLEKRGESG